MRLLARKLSERKFKLSDEGQEKCDKFLDSLKVGTFFNLDITKEDIRSIQQNKLYWSKIIPGLQYYDDTFTFCNGPGYKPHIDNCHYTIKLIFCFERRPDLIEEIEYFDPQERKIKNKCIPFSHNFDKMKHADANEYINFCIHRVELASSMDFDKAVGLI